LLQDLQVLQDPLEYKVSRVFRVQLAQLDIQDHKVLLVPKELRVFRVTKV
jgi:hypothetical protein